MDNNHKNDIRKLLELADTNEKIITYDVCGENIIIKVKPYISLEERCNLIENAVELCFTNDGEHRNTRL